MADGEPLDPIVGALPDRRRRRHEGTKNEILETAWALARREGIGALSLRELAEAVGMKAPSLYTYFPSKQSIYDAMFAQGWRLLLERVKVLEPNLPQDEHLKAESLRTEARDFFAFCTEDPARYQLMFQRPMPGFVPSPEAYASSEEVFDRLRGRFARLGLDDDAIELWTFLMTGITARQIANEPGGDRYLPYLDELVDMFVAHVELQTKGKERKR